MPPAQVFAGDIGPEEDPHSVEAISAGQWEDVLERFTEDMEPWDLDIVKLADRYKSYIERLERFDLEVPGRVIYIGAVLLRMKAEILREEYGDKEEEEAEMGMDDMFDFEEDDLEPVAEEQLRIPEAVPTPPVKKKGKRKVTLTELKDALEKALEIEEQRETRQETRKEAEDYGIEVEEDDISDKLDSLYGRLKGFLTRSKDAVTFSNIVEEEHAREQVETFVHLMHLETEERVRCRQEEFLGELEIEVLEDADEQDSAA